MSHAASYLKNVSAIASEIDPVAIDAMASELAKLRNNSGRLFFLGAGGSAANGSHAVNDFRKLAKIETYTPIDNVSELTARTNDEGWESVFVEWLKVSKLRDNDALFILSVGGGDAERSISVNLIHAIDYAKKVGAKVFGVVGRDGGYTAKKGDSVIVIPTIDADNITPLAESFQSVLLHGLISHPALLANSYKWESGK